MPAFNIPLTDCEKKWAFAEIGKFTENVIGGSNLIDEKTDSLLERIMGKFKYRFWWIMVL